MTGGGRSTFTPFRSQRLARLTPGPPLPRFQFHSKENSDSNSLVAAQPISRAPRPQPLRARAAPGFGSDGPREGAQANGRSEPPAAPRSPRAPRRGSLPGPATWLRRAAAGGPRAGACARRSRACRPHSPHPLGELVTSCPRPISVRGQSVAPPSLPESLCFPFSSAPRRRRRLSGEGETEKERD